MRPVDRGWSGPDARTGQAAGSRAACLYWPDEEVTYQETLEGGAASDERSTATVLAQALHVEPVNSLEVRWILPGAPGSAVRQWFARFPAKAETREDTYLVFPPMDGLSLKFRAGRTLEAKCYLGSPGLLCLPVRGLGRLESWRKWSFPDDLLRPVDKLTSAWVTVRKSRRSIRFPLSVRQDPVPEPFPDGAGCTAELTEADVGGQPMWTVGLEATGPDERLSDAIRDAVRQLFASPLPSQAWFSLGNSWSYTHWLYRQPNLNTAIRLNRRTP
jgi:hypothetical protein